MPSLTFVMPHWLYWAGLLLFPLFAMYMVRRTRAASTTGGVSLSIGYLFLVTAGFVGIHRFYMRNMLGFLYLPLSAGILYANGRYRAAREAVSEVKRQLMSAEFLVDRFQRAVEGGSESAVAQLESARRELTQANAHIVEANTQLATWDAVAMWLAIAIAVFLVVDAILLPRMARQRARIEGPSRAGAGGEPVQSPVAAESHGGPAVARAIDRISGWSGYFVCYWSLIAVYVYYYEVLARYVFNSPTNWAHESMFLMFGMQYLIAGAFALREDSHVRVDVIYTSFPERLKALVDVVTSLFFFLFTGALLVTGWIFFVDSVNVWEVSFTEWAIQYWPVKGTIALGALLILLQGVAKLIRDVRVLLLGSPG